MKCKMILPAILCGLVTSAVFATNYVWTDGWYRQSTVNPQLPLNLSASDTLYIGTKTNSNNNISDPYEGLKVFDCGALNNLGTIVWSDSAWDLYFTSGPTYGTTVITNQGLFDARVDRAMLYMGGWGNNTFLNDAGATFRKSAGTGTMTFATANAAADEFKFYNRGTLDAQVGTILYGSPISHFENGTLFTGTGIHRIAAVYNTELFGSITAAPESTVIFDSSYNGGGVYNQFTGTGAILHGHFYFQSGTLKGDWTIAADSVMDMATNSGKIISNAQITNSGTFNISQGINLGIGSSTFSNLGLVDFLDDSDFYYGGDGWAPTFSNFGTLRKSGGMGTSNLGIADWSNMNFSTAPGSVIEVQTGTLAILCNSFTINSGTIIIHNGTTLQGRYNLTNSGIIRGEGTVEITSEHNRLINEGQIHPGDTTGTLSVRNNFQQNTNGHLNIEIGGTAAGQYDVLAVSGEAVLNGTVDFWRLPGYTPAAGDTFVFLTTGGSISGTATPVFHGFDGVTFSAIAYGTNSASVTVLGVAYQPWHLGDINQSGRVDLVDFDLFAAEWLKTDCGTCGGADLTGDHNVTIDDLFRFVQNWLAVRPSGPDIFWISVSETGFTGQMSKYETTNAQYCLFLNAALATGDIVVNGNYIKGAAGTNPGTDYAGNYYNLVGSGYNAGDAVNGGAARINYSGGQFTVDSGFENHPVTYVSALGAMAFCNYYGWRLPDEWEWQAVADYNGGYTYGCGTAINTGNANFASSSHPYGTKEVGIMGTYGHGMCDMAANAWEWTSSTYLNNHYIRGGGWNSAAAACMVSYRWEQSYDILNAMTGFRVCR